MNGLTVKQEGRQESAMMSIGVVLLFKSRFSNGSVKKQVTIPFQVMFHLNSRLLRPYTLKQQHLHSPAFG